MRVGLLGGTFNPIHNGHIVLAEEALRQLSLDKVIFIPTFIPPHKDPTKLIDAQHRLKMIELAIGANPKFEISRCEIERGQKSYSIDTVEYFKKSYPEGTEFFFLIGADNFKKLDKWRDINRLLTLCRFIVADRRGFSEGLKYPGVERIKITPVDISSTEIRRRIKSARPITRLLPKAVEDYIISNNLYKNKG